MNVGTTNMAMQSKRKQAGGQAAAGILRFGTELGAADGDHGPVQPDWDHSTCSPPNM